MFDSPGGIFGSQALAVLLTPGIILWWTGTRSRGTLAITAKPQVVG